MQAMRPRCSSVDFSGSASVGAGAPSGFSAQIAPDFEVRQNDKQSQENFASRSLDAFAMMQVSKEDNVRVSVNGLFQPKQGNRVFYAAKADFSINERKPVPWWSVNWEHKF